MDNETGSICLTTAVSNVSHFNRRSKRCDMTSSAVPRLKNLITIVSTNWLHTVSTRFDAALLLSWRILTTVSFSLRLYFHLSALSIYAASFFCDQVVDFLSSYCLNNVWSIAVDKAFVFRRCVTHCSLHLLIWQSSNPRKFNITSCSDQSYFVVHCFLKSRFFIIAS